MAEQKKKSPIIIIGLVLLIVVVLIICLFVMKPVMVKKQVRETTENMMQAYLQKDLSQALSYTDLKEHSEEGITYCIDYLEETSRIDSLTGTILKCSTDTFEDIVLNLIRDYKIEGIDVEKDNAIIHISLTIPNFVQVSQWFSGKEGGKDMLGATLTGFGNVDLVSKIKDIFGDPNVETVTDSVLGVAGEYVEGAINDYFVAYNKEIISVDDAEISVSLRAYKEGDVWGIKADDIIGAIIKESEKTYTE